MKLPGPDHPIAIVPQGGRVRVVFNGRVVADSTRALIMREAHLAPVFYIPRDEADMSLLARSATSTHCPYKGDASYFTIHAGDRTSPDAAWSYETPFPAMVPIAGRLAFYANRVDAIVESD